MAAFEQARGQGAAAVELDARMCGGSSVVVFHDATLSRATGGNDSRLVSDVGIRELRAMGVPTLLEVLSWARSHGIGVNVEMKHDVPDRAALAHATVSAVRATGGDALLSSFDPVLLAIAAASVPALPRGLIVRAGQPIWGELLQRAARPPLVGWLHLERPQCSARAVGRHVRRGLRIGVWTVNHPGEAIDFVRLGVTSIITDTPGAILEALAVIRM
jgi:glycerophosphoryl diester phosphodiesterase